MTCSSRPLLAPKVRLRQDRIGKAHWLLLYPERGLLLNTTAAEILRKCTGAKTVQNIIDDVTQQYTDQPRDVVQEEILAFLRRLARKRLIREE